MDRSGARRIMRRKESPRFSPPGRGGIFEMIDYVIRNARVHGRGDTPADIGFEKWPHRGDRAEALSAMRHRTTPRAACAAVA